MAIRPLTAGYAGTAIGYGFLCGLFFALSEMIACAIGRQPLALPWFYAASVVVGPRAVLPGAPWAMGLVGAAVHFALSGWFGLLYVGLTRGSSGPVRSNGGWQAGFGMLYGLLIWVFDFEFVARGLFPWLLRIPQFLQLALHVVFYGLPLGLLLGNVERRYYRVVRRREAIP
jgi:hypothetical protein